MKSFVFFTLVLLFGYLIGFIKYDRNKKHNWMDKDFTAAIKGFSILTVVWAHTGACLGINGIQFIAGVGVSLFLICSGYGLELSYEKNGLKDFWKKRILKVCIPFWIAELIGLIISGNWQPKRYFLDMFFIKSATGYGWFVGYIVICYIIFFFIQILSDKFKLINNKLLNIFLVFGVWFLIEGIWFANPNMPFLKARQMFAFPLGMLIAVKREEIIKFKQITKLLIIIGGLLTGLFFMAVTQIKFIKNLPYLLSNIMSLFTVLPISVSVLIIVLMLPKLIMNYEFSFIGKISYEIYLVHSFTLALVKNSFINISIFILVTLILSYIFHIFVIKGYKYGRLNSCNSYKK